MGQEITTKGWFLIDHYHGPAIELLEVAPEDDIRDHIVSMDCECIPRMEKNIEGIPLLIHNAFDGREDERGN